MITFRNKISQGSLLTYDGVLGTLSSMEFISDADIGMALKDGSTATWTGAVTSTKVIIIPIKPTADTTLILDAAVTKLEISGGSITGTGLTNCYIAEYRNSLLDTNTVTLNKWQLIIAEFSSGITFGTNVKYSLSANCQMGEVIMLDTIPDNYTSYHRWFNNLTRKGLKKTNLLDQYIFNTKPTDLSREDGLVAAFTFKLGSTDDISGNGNHATNNGATPTIRGMKLDGNDDDMFITIPNTLTSWTLAFHISPYDLSNWNSILTNALAAPAGFRELNFFNNNQLGIWSNILSGEVLASGLSTYLMYDFVITYDGVNGICYTNGVETYNKVANFGSILSGLHYLGSYRGIGQFNNTEYENFRIYNSVWDIQQAKDYHNSFMFPTILDKGIGDAVGNTPQEWVKGTTGALTVEEVTSGTLPIGTKYIKLSTTGTCYINNSDMALLVDNGYADYWALISGTWTHRQGLVSAMTELSYANDKLTYTTANAGDGFAISGQYSFLIKAGATV